MQVRDRTHGDPALAEGFGTAADQFLGWMASDRMCVDTVLLRRGEPTWERKKRHYSVGVDPTTSLGTWELRWMLCTAVDDRENFLRKADEGLFEGGITQQSTFLAECASGPSLRPFLEQARRCPDSRDAEQRFLDREVFSGFEPATAKNLAVDALPAVRLPGGVPSLVQISTPFPEGWLALSGPRDAMELLSVGPEGVEILGEMSLDDGEWITGMAATQDWAVVLSGQTWSNPESMLVFNLQTGEAQPRTLAERVTMKNDVEGIGLGDVAVFQEGELGENDALMWVERTTGEVERIELPAPVEPQVAMIQGLHTNGAVTWVHWYDATVEFHSPDFVTVTSFDHHYGLVDAETRAITEIPVEPGDPHIYGIGVDAQGRLLGTVEVVDDGWLLVALDADGRWSAWGGECFTDPWQRPTMVVDGQAWWLGAEEADPTELVIEAYAVE